MKSDMDTNRPAKPERWMLYGANGYTGRLIAAEACRRGLRPVLAGRNAEAIETLAAELGCDCRTFNLTSHESIVHALRDVSVLLHCAGPFSSTAAAMAAACIDAGTHYMDITGEIPVLESLYLLHADAVAAGITMIPGSGFDVVPTDCLALSLKEDLPDATELRIAFAGKLAQSPGTWRATLEAIPRCGAIRRNGELTTVPHAWRAERIRFFDGMKSTMTIPWGDLSSAWRSTSIPNIVVYGGVSKASIVLMQMMRGAVCALMANSFVHRTVRAAVSLFVRGPGEEHRNSAVYHIRADVWNARGDHLSRHLETPEGYACTVRTTLEILRALLAGEVPPGVWTPAQAMGSAFIYGLPGFRLVECEDEARVRSSEYAFDT